MGYNPIPHTAVIQTTDTMLNETIEKIESAINALSKNSKINTIWWDWTKDEYFVLTSDTNEEGGLLYHLTENCTIATKISIP